MRDKCCDKERGPRFGARKSRQLTPIFHDDARVLKPKLGPGLINDGRWPMLINRQRATACRWQSWTVFTRYSLGRTAVCCLKMRICDVDIFCKQNVSQNSLEKGSLDEQYRLKYTEW